MLKKSTAILFLTLIMSAWTACSRPPQRPAPTPAAERSAEAQAALQAEENAPAVQQDFTGVETEVTGALSYPNSLDEPDETACGTGEPGWVDVQETRTFSNSVSPDQATEELLQILRNRAISKKVPESVEVTTLMTNSKSETNDRVDEQFAWYGFFRSTVSGIITAEEIVLDTLQPQKNGYQKTIWLRAYVEPVRGRRDSGFTLDARLENNLLKSGDELIITVTPSKDSYLYVFNLMADHNIMFMFPNEYFRDNFIKGGTTVQIPDPAIRNYIQFRVAPLPGEDLTGESVFLVATREQAPQLKDLPLIGSEIRLFPEKSDDFIKLQRWLTSIPLDQRVEENLIYHVSK